MNGRYLPSERLVALFLFAVLLFNPPLLLIFDSPSTVAGVPVLYLYLFAAWAALVGLLAIVSELSLRSDEPDDLPDASPGRDDDVLRRPDGGGV